MPRVSDEYRSERRTQILSAALHCFARKGFAGTSMSDIIAESKLSAGAIYGHFTNKEDLINAAASFILGRRVFDLQARISAESLDHPATAIQHLVAGFERDIAHLDLILQVWSQCALDPHLRSIFNEAWREITAALKTYIAAWLEQAGIATDTAERRARDLAPIYSALMQGYVVHNTLIDDFSASTYFATIKSLPLLASQ